MSNFWYSVISSLLSKSLVPPSAGILYSSSGGGFLLLSCISSACLRFADKSIVAHLQNFVKYLAGFIGQTGNKTRYIHTNCRLSPATRSNTEIFFIHCLY